MCVQCVCSGHHGEMLLTQVVMMAQTRQITLVRVAGCLVSASTQVVAASC